MDPTSANPFLDDIFVDHPDSLPGVGRMHQAVFSQVLEAVEHLLEGGGSSTPGGSVGRIFLIKAPEAGYGKSHLVARLREHIGAIAATVILPFDRSRPVSWPIALSSVLRQFSAPNPSRNQPITALEEISRFFLSRLVLSGLESGTVKERDCPEVSSKIRSDFAFLFSREADSKILFWADKRSSELSRPLDPSFLKDLGMGQAELVFWTRLFIDLNLREEGALDRLRGLSNGEARERLVQFLRIATDYRPVMLVADGLDGFFGSETSGMDITEMVTGIREKVCRTVTLVCVNEDVWDSVFQNRLPSAWQDRLSGETLRLRAITPEGAGDLIRSRLQRVGMTTSATERFVQRLSDDHLWVDTETKLTPRSVLRQGNDLWKREAGAFLSRSSEEEEEYADLLEEPLCNLTDKAEFLNPVREERPAPEAPATPPPLPREPEPAAPEPNPFFPSAPRLRESELAGIDSIISDIRGSGKTVVSEAAENRPMEKSDYPTAAEVHPSPAPAAPAMSFQAGDLGVTSTRNGEARADHENPDFFASSANPSKTERNFGPLCRSSLERLLAQREAELLSGPALTLDLERLERFIRTIGRQHAALGQQEERYPSSRTICLRWSVRGQSVLTGFESPRNVYFWNNLLQQSLASNRIEKIAAFSHATEPFDPALFSSFGFSPAVIQGRIDVISLSDRELAILYAADDTLKEFEGGSEAGKASQLITLHLDPLWRRMIQAV